MNIKKLIHEMRNLGFRRVLEQEPPHSHPGCRCILADGKKIIITSGVASIKGREFDIASEIYNRNPTTTFQTWIARGDFT